MRADVIAAYSASAEAWAVGPEQVYGRLAEMLVERCPGGVAGRRVLDAGAGTGAAGRAALAAGARGVVAVDAALGMARRLRGVAGDVLALPFATGRFGAAVAAFSLNHLPDPAAGLRELARVVAPGGGIVAGAYAADDEHPVKAAVDAAAAALGWTPPGWYGWLRQETIPALATEEGAAAALAAAGLDGTVEHVRVPIDVDAAGMVAWRLGMAHLAPFVAGLGRAERAALVDDARSRLGDAPPLERSVLVLGMVVSQMDRQPSPERG